MSPIKNSAKAASELTEIWEQLDALVRQMETQNLRLGEFGQATAERLEALERQMSIGGIVVGSKVTSNTVVPADFGSILKRLEVLMERIGKINSEQIQRIHSLEGMHKNVTALQQKVEEVSRNQSSQHEEVKDWFVDADQRIVSTNQRLETTNERLEATNERLESLEKKIDMVVSQTKVASTNTEFLRRTLNSEESTRMNVEHALEIHPEWFFNPLEAYAHHYTVGNEKCEPRDKTLIFLHLKKTGGSTLTHIIHRNVRSIGFRKDFLRLPNLPTRSVLAAFRRLPTELQDVERKKWDKYDVLANHGMYGMHELLSRDYEYMTMLRHPVDRLVSYYRYIQNLPAISWKGTETGSERAGKQSLMEFIHDPEFRSQILSYHSYVSIFSGEPQDVLTKKNAELAKKNLQGFAAVLLMEQFDASVEVLHKLYGWKDEIMVNGTPELRKGKVVGDITGSQGAHKDLGDAERKEIETLLKYDIEIYELGKTLFQKQCEELGVANVTA